VRWLRPLGIVCPLLVLTAPVRAEAADGPVGSAYLRTLSAREPPSGRLIRDAFPYDGVRVQRWRRDDPAADWLVVWVDLRTPGLGYSASPVHYRTGPAGVPVQAAHAQTTVDFLRHTGGPPVDLAVNTVAYWPFPATDGMPVFLSEPVWQGGDDGRDPVAGTLMLGLLPGRAVLGEPAAVREARPQVAFGSFHGDERPEESVLVRGGEPVRHGGSAHGRTAAGIDVDGRVLLLLVADGYNPGVSEGLSPGDAAGVLAAAGAHTAVLLDGGGSSTLVGRGPGGTPVVVNRPAGLQRRPGTLRSVAVNLGLTGLRRGDDPLPALAEWEAPFHVRTWEQIVLQFRVRPVRATVIASAAVAVLVLVTVLLRRRWRGRGTRGLTPARGSPPP
jgi:hypothetical protein